MENVAGTSWDPYFCPSQRTDNLARLCQLILTICTDILRDVLSKYISPTNLENELNKKKSLLENIFNKHQNLQIYPAAKASTRRHVRSTDFDISVLYILLRNICGISGHTGGWGKAPHDGDYSTSACIERIRMERNVVSAHSADGGMDTSTFMSHWKELKECIIHLEEYETGGDMYQRGIDCLYESDLNPAKTKNCIEEMKSIKDELGITKGKVAELETTVVNVKSMVGKKMALKADRIEKFVGERQRVSTAYLSQEVGEVRKDIKDFKRKNTDENNSITKKIKDEFESLSSKINSRLEELETNQCSTVHDRMNGLEENISRCEDGMKNELKSLKGIMESTIQGRVDDGLEKLTQSLGDDFSRKLAAFEEKIQDRLEKLTQSQDSKAPIRRNSKPTQRPHCKGEVEQNQAVTFLGNNSEKKLSLMRPNATVHGENESWLIKGTTSSLTKRKNEHVTQVISRLENKSEDFWVISKYLDDSGIPLSYKLWQYTISDNEFVQSAEITIHENNLFGSIFTYASDRNSVLFFSESQNSVRSIELGKKIKTKTHFFVNRRVLAFGSGCKSPIIAWEENGLIQLNSFKAIGTETGKIATDLLANQEIRFLQEERHFVYILQRNLTVLDESGKVIYTIQGGEDLHNICDFSVDYGWYEGNDREAYIAYQKAIDIINKEGKRVNRISFEGAETIKNICALSRNCFIIVWDSNTIDVFRKETNNEKSNDLSGTKI